MMPPASLMALTPIVCPRPRQDDCKPVAVLLGQRAKEGVDRRALAPRLVELDCGNVVIGYLEASIGRNHVDVIGLERHGPLDLGDWRAWKNSWSARIPPAEAPIPTMRGFATPRFSWPWPSRSAVPSASATMTRLTQAGYSGLGLDRYNSHAGIVPDPIQSARLSQIRPTDRSIC